MDIIEDHWGEIGDKETYHKNFNDKTADRFIDQLKSFNLLNWKQKYEEPRVLDGTQWQIDIFRECRDLVKCGNNAFPDEWHVCCSTISKIAGCKFI